MRLKMGLEDRFWRGILRRLALDLQKIFYKSKKKAAERAPT